MCCPLIFSLFTYTSLFRSFYGGLSFSILLLIMTCGLMTNIKNANSVDIPTLLLANDIHPYIGIFMSAVMIGVILDRKSTRLNSSHVSISYAVFCLKKKKMN